MSEESSGNKPVQAAHVTAAKKGWGVAAGTFWAFVAFIVPQFVAALLSPTIAGLSLTNNTKFFVLHAVVQLFTLAILFTIIHAYGLGPRSIGLARFKIKHINWVVVILPLYFFASILIAFLISNIVPSEILEQPQKIGFTGGSGLELACIFIALVIITPFVEEVIFRGFLLRAYNQKFSAFTATLIVSILFAIAHGQINVGIDVFLLSLALCYVRLKSDSLWPSILMHSLKNFVAFFLLFIIGVT